MIILFFLFAIIAVLLFFYRYPTPIKRKNDFNNVYSPAFGRIMKIIETDNQIFIAIFLSPLDIHYQFFPVAGTVTDIQYDCNGVFNLAYELNKSNQNEKVITTMTNKHGEFKIFQIAGYLVRRISNFSKVNQTVESGEDLGLIHFGSRVDIIIPKSDSKFKLLVKEGEYVSGFNTLLGSFTDSV
jgi:phosphatidylserine decarboxylase